MNLLVAFWHVLAICLAAALAFTLSIMAVGLVFIFEEVCLWVRRLFSR